ncbi:metallo-beta-lactamase family protein isoform X3 [Carex rostrata]
MALALTGSLLRPRYQPLVPSRSGRNELSAARFRLVVVAGTGSARERRPQNVEGNFFVDHTCIDCDTCRWMAPDFFARIDKMSAVTKQPASKDENIKALQALLSCPTNSIHTEKKMKEVVEVNKTFPLPIDESDIPGVYHCGYHSEKSYGAAPYFISHPEGNIMVDVPKYTEILAREIDKLGGIRYLFLTHKDDIAEHDKWAKRFKCERIMHIGDVEYRTEDVERKLHGDGPWTIGSDFELVHTPGHTDGSVCLYYRPMKVLFTGDHLCLSGETGDLDMVLIYNKQSDILQLDSVRKLLDLNFNWILPGHGRRIRFKDNDEKNSAIEAYLATQEHIHDNSNTRNKEPLLA